MSHIYGRKLRLTTYVVGIIVATLVVISAVSVPVFALAQLSSTWPNAQQFTGGGETGTGVNFLIDSDHGDSKNGYFSIFLPRTGNYALRYNNYSCSSRVTSGNTNLHVYIDEQGLDTDNNIDTEDTVANGGDRDITYGSQANICSDHDIPIPARPAGCESALVGNRCRVNVRFQMTCTNSPNCNWSDGMIIKYILSVLKDGGPAPDALIAPMKDRNGFDNGIIFKKQSDSSYYGTADYNFGVPCSAPDTTGVIRFGDTDPDLNGTAPGGSDNPVRARLYKTDSSGVTTTIAADTTSGANDHGSGASLYYTLSQSGSFSITMRKNERYTVRFWNIFTQKTGIDSPGSNYVSVSIPGDGIYGSADYTCPPPNSNVISCGSTTFVGVIPTSNPYSFTIAAVGTLNAPTSITATVNGPSGFTQTSTVATSISGLTGTAGFTFTPTTAGNYGVNWSASDAAGISVSGCSAAVSASTQPYFQVNGGDIIAGVGFPGETAPDSVASAIASWDSSAPDYNGARGGLAAIARGSITQFSTLGGSTNPSKLAFANTTASGTKYGGDFNAFPSSTPDYIANATAAAGSGGVITSACSSPINLGSLASGIYHCNGNVTVSASTIGTGKHVTLIVEGGSAFISGNLTYSYAYSGPTDTPNIPRLNIYTTGNIVVAGGVSEMHGVFVAQSKNSKFYSCGSAAGGYAYTTLAAHAECISRLTVYGSVVAGELVLGRTAGSWADNDGAAETLIHNPETWLTQPYATAPGTTQTKFDSYISLPPLL